MCSTLTFPPDMFIRLDSIMYTEQFPCWVDKAELYPGSAAAAGKSLQSCPTLRDPMDRNLPGSSVHGIVQARVLEWGAIAFSDTQALAGSKHDCSSVQTCVIRTGRISNM